MLKIKVEEYRIASFEDNFLFYISTEKKEQTRNSHTQ